MTASPSLSSPKIWFITGVSSGFGRALAQEALAAGYRVVGTLRNEAARAEFDALQPGRSFGRLLDVTHDTEVVRVVAKVETSIGPIDVLVNNAGYGHEGTVEESSLDQLRQQFEVNVFGAVAIAKAVLPFMRARRRGHILNITSMGGKMYSILGAWYHATKHALEGWSDCLRLEVGEFGIKVVIVEPGVIETGFGDAASDTIVKRSASGPYGRLVQMVAKSIKNTYGHGTGSDPSVIADVVSQAVSSSNPRTRYAAGKFAKMLIRMRIWLGDRMFDRIILSQTR